jgi:hypothetical protein
MGEALAQPAYDHSRLCTERLGRGVVAVRQADGRVFISWRTLPADRPHQAFDVYRNGRKVNQQPLDRGGTWLVDEQPLAADSDVVYTVRPLLPVAHADVPDGQFTLRTHAPEGYMSIPLQKPADGVTSDGRRYGYTANDASVGDVDGDGAYELFLKWDPTNAHDNSHDGYTGSTLIDCYKMADSKWPNSQLLWRIDLGRNIRSGAHYVPYIVYDLDGDGRAELMVKTADGTRDGQGHVIGDSTADWRNPVGRILDGPEYITVFDGLTGRALDTKLYTPQRGNVADWGDSRGNRSERYLAAVGYFGAHAGDADGKGLPSAVFCRGYYTRSVLAAWDWDGHELRQRWVFDTKQAEWASYAGQGNHNLRVADVDGDGMDEIIYGAMAVDHDGRGLYNTAMGHGDAMHLVPHPVTGKLYIWDCHENRRDGSELHDAQTGEVVFQITSRDDVGRCMAADIDPTSAGMEMWSTDSHGVRTMTGDVLGSAQDASNPQHDNYMQMGRRHLSINYGIWWDGDLLRELLDRQTVTKYNWEQQTVIDVQRFEGAMFNNGTKSNPCLQADILGDWREEVVTRNRESTELRIYVSTIPTDYRINCLMHDIPYRLSVAYQNVGYNQPPEPGFYLGPDRTDYLR